MVEGVAARELVRQLLDPAGPFTRGERVQLVAQLVGIESWLEAAAATGRSRSAVNRGRSEGRRVARALDHGAPAGTVRAGGAS
jgi:hypothetical protein